MKFKKYMFARLKQICTPYWNYLRKCNLTKSRLAAIFAAHIRNTINTLKLTFKTFITKKCVLITWTKTWAGRMVLGVGRERWGRVSGNTQCCTSTNISLCALTSVNPLYACFQKHAGRNKTRKEPECMICNLSLHALITYYFVSWRKKPIYIL